MYKGAFDARVDTRVFLEGLRVRRTGCLVKGTEFDPQRISRPVAKKYLPLYYHSMGRFRTKALNLGGQVAMVPNRRGS